MRFLLFYSKILCCVQLLGLVIFVLPLIAAEGTGSSVLLKEKQWYGDFTQLKEKGAIRVLVPVSNPDFFVDGFRKYGLTPDLIQKFQEYLNESIVQDTFVRVIIIPTSRATIIDRLAEGYGDLAVANLTITESRLKRIDFATPIKTGVKEIVVTAPGSPVLHSLSDLSGKNVYARSFSSYYEHLLCLNTTFAEQGLEPVTIELLPDELEDDNLLALVNASLIPYTIMDHRKVEFWQNVYTEAVAYPDLAIDSNGNIAWLVRKNSPELLKIVSDFSLNQQNAPVDLEELRENTDKELIRFSGFEGETIDTLKELYPIFLKAGKQNNIPPQLLAALAFERSDFTETKVGKNGEVGIMQLAPFIEREVTFESSKETDKRELHIRAAAKYLASLRDETFKDLADDPKNQLYFTLAAYLDGPEKISEMRWITSQMGKNGNTWFNEVNVTVSRLIGRENVRAVRAIALYWIGLNKSIESGKIVLPEAIN